MALNKKHWLFTVVFLFCISATAQQSIQVKQFSHKDGITQPFIYSINQDNKGYLWIGTGEGVYKYNGFDFYQVLGGDSLSENYISVGYTDPKGHIWWGHQEGGITKYSKGKFRQIDVSGMPSGRINAIKTDDKGNTWYAIQGAGLVKIEGNTLTNYSDAFEDLIVYDFEFAHKGLLLVGTDDGLYLYQVGKSGSPTKLIKVNKIPLVTINHVSESLQDEDTFWIGTADHGLFKINVHPKNKDFIEVVPIGEGYQLNNKFIKHILEDRSGNLWISTYGDGIFKASYSASAKSYIDIQMIGKNFDLSSVDINLVFEDREGNIWAGSHGGSLYFVKDNLFEQYLHSSDNVYFKNVRSILVDDYNYFYGSMSKVIIERKSDNSSDYYDVQHGLPEEDLITAIYRDSKGNLWVGTDQNGAYLKRVQSDMFEPLNLSLDNLANSVNSITGGDQFIWIATKFGLFKYNTITESFEKYSTENELKHNNISQLYKDPNSQDIWVATQSNFLSRIRGSQIEDFPIKTRGSILNIQSVHGDSKDNIWIATLGDGVFKFDKITKEFSHFGLNRQLLSEYCYSLMVDDNDNVWVGHRGGVSRIIPQKNQVKRYESTNGFNGDCYENSIFRDEDNNVWFGTNNGAFKFVQSKDIVNTIPPKTDLLLVNVSSGNSETTYTSGPIELPYDAYKVRFEFIGLSFKNSADVTYEFMLDGYDLEWTKASVNNFAQYNRLEEGNYTFKVRSCNSDGFCSTQETSIRIIVATPYWKKWWFITLCASLLVAGVVFYIRFRERRQRQMQEYLQTELNARTKEVVEQKEELERKNKDITDSINYAKRIQRAVIPNYTKLKDVFPESYIFFKPRDIVSGDFYWMYQPDMDTFLIACADATGHGVPGAFMSLIGSTILQDAVRRPNVQSPEDILTTLERELNALLTSDSKEGNPKDGMDISVLEFNLKTNKVRICSAMRPVFIIKDGELVNVRGNRNPIGGGYKNFKKEFRMEHFELGPGDGVYMFTDGYPDQFGGPDGKKFKVSRLKQIIEGNHDKSAMDQLEELDRQFSLWTEGHKQIDDVLVIGIKV